MTETNPKNGFWQFPLTLKLAVLWIFINSIDHLLAIRNMFDHNPPYIKFGDFVAAVVFFSLGVGLVDKRDSSRIWSSFWVMCGTLIRFYLLSKVILYEGELEATLYLLSMKYLISKEQAIVFLISNVLINAGVIFTLLRPRTKALFSTQVSQPISQETI